MKSLFNFTKKKENSRTNMINNFEATRKIKMTPPESIDNFDSFRKACNGEFEKFKKEMCDKNFARQYCSKIDTLEEMRNSPYPFSVAVLAEYADYVTEFITRVFAHQLEHGKTDIVTEWAKCLRTEISGMSRNNNINETSITNCLAIYRVLKDSKMSNDPTMKQIINFIEQFAQDTKMFKVLF